MITIFSWFFILLHLTSPFSISLFLFKALKHAFDHLARGYTRTFCQRAIA